MPAQPPNQQEDNNASNVADIGGNASNNQQTTPNGAGSNTTTDPYSTLRAEKVAAADASAKSNADGTMTESKRLELAKSQQSGSQANLNQNVNSPAASNQTPGSQNTSSLNQQNLNVKQVQPAQGVPNNNQSNTTPSGPVASITSASSIGSAMKTPQQNAPTVSNRGQSPPAQDSTAKPLTSENTITQQKNSSVNNLQNQSTGQQSPSPVKIPNQPSVVAKNRPNSTPQASSAAQSKSPSLEEETQLPAGMKLVDKNDEPEKSEIANTTRVEQQKDEGKNEGELQKSQTVDSQTVNTEQEPPKESQVKETDASSINKTDEDKEKSIDEKKTEDSSLDQKNKQEKPSIADNQNATQSSTSDAKTLSDVLVDLGILDRKTADEVKLAEVQSGNSQEDILNSQNLANSKQISKAKAKLYNVDYIDLTNIPVDPEALGLLPQQVAEKFNVFPVSIDIAKNKVTIAMADPLNLTAIEFIEQRTGKSVDPKAADPEEIQNLIAAGYTTSLAKEVSEALKDVSEERSKVKTLDAGRTGLIREEKVAEVVTHILGFAVKSRASDVHIEPQEHATRVRYRIDGILQEKLTIPKELHDALVSRIKILSGMKIDEKRVPQDGRFNFKSDVEEVDLRVSTLPTAWGEKIVMRLLKKSGGIPELPELGLRGRALKNLQEAILKPHGIVLITGPTGSGKTTTLYSIIQKLNTSKVNIMTLEDPIEYKIHGVNQVQANPSAGLTFASGMRSFLRQDPNIILVGEIRDQETADLAIQASLTGHLVFSTLHTNSAAGALPRLLDMGAEPYLLASSITAIVGQRVVRKIHQDCKTSYVPDPKVIEEMKEVLGDLWKPKPGEIKLQKGQGDKDCNNSGYLGRVGIFEVLPVSEKIGRLILEQAPSGDIDKQAKSEGMVTMKQDGYLKVVEGITTIDEVLRVAQE